MTARTGEKRKRMEVQKKTETRSGEGDFIEGWVTENSMWAKLNPVGAQERIDGDQTTNIRTHRVTMSFYSPGITGAARLKMGSRIFNIVSVVNVGERGIDTVLDVKEQEVA